MSRTPVLSAAVALLLSACATAPQADVAADEQAIRDVSAHWLELETARDAAGIAALFTADGTLYRPGREPVAGTAGIQQYMADQFREDPGASATWATDHIEVAASGDIAVEHGTWSSTGGNDGPDQGWYQTLHRKVNGEWKVVSDVTISTKPEAPAVAPAQ